MPSVNRPFKFTVQYKMQGDWEEYQKTYTFSEQNGNITISGLEKSRNYYIRYMLWTEEGKMTDQNVPVNYFMTTCDGKKIDYVPTQQFEGRYVCL